MLQLSWHNVRLASAEGLYTGLAINPLFHYTLFRVKRPTVGNTQFSSGTMYKEPRSNKYGPQWILIRVYFNRGTIKKVGRVRACE